ncbi:hypothetical protein [Flavobacterium gelatinilyticum]|uniref:hypothetical protein n=1 Tax=Flavobacterium gelatinilyticum TaxID=3003260 RepID=UPI0024802F0A|nr:hypothetical protein [Flavobacterium gelatinilyticum]
MSEPIKRKFKINWSIVIAIISIALTALWKFYPVEATLKYNILLNTSVLDIKADVAKLKVSYDSIDLIKGKQNVSIVIMQVRNDGNKDIKLEDYDRNNEFGFRIENGKILNKPEIVRSSDLGYFSDVVSDFTENKVKFKYKLIDEDQFWTIKFLVIHSKKEQINIIPIGKISGMKKIDIPTNADTNAELLLLRSQYKRSLILLVSSLMLLVLLIAFVILNLKSRRLLREYYKSLQIDSFSEKISESASNEEIGDLLPLDELVKLQKGQLIYHEKFGEGEVIEIEKFKDIGDARGTFKFEKKTVKLLLRFAPLYKLNK